MIIDPEIYLFIEPRTVNFFAVNHNKYSRLLTPDISTGMAIKPTSSILLPRPSIDLQGQPTEVLTKGRHDPCVGLRAVPIAEALLALVLMDHALRHRAQCGDVRLEQGPIAAAAPAPG